MAANAATEIKPKVLLVDDQEGNLLALEVPLRNLHCDIIKYTSGREAVEFLESNEVAVILLDVKMPIMDGFEVAAKIREIPESANTPIIFVTGVEQTEEYISKAVENGSAYFIYKPINEKVLISKVSVFLELYQSRLAIAEQLSEALPIITFIADADSNLLQLNSRWYEYTGYRRGDTSAESWVAAIHPDDFPLVVDAWETARVQNKKWNQKYRLKRHDGIYRLHLGTSIPQTDGRTKITKWIGTVADIEDATESQREVEDTLESMSDAFFAIDKDWKITRVNAHHVKTTKIKREDQLGKNLKDLFFNGPELEESIYLKSYEHAMQERKFVSFEDYYPPLDLWTEVRVYPKSNGGLAIFFTDIGQRKKQELQLANERQKLQALISESSSAIGLMRGSDLVFEVINKRWEELVSPREYLGRPYIDVYPELVGTPAHQSLLDIFETGVPFVASEMKLKVTSPAGVLEDQYFDYTNVRINDADGKPYGVYCNALNVSERVLARKKVEETSERLRLALEGGDMGVWTIRLPEGVITGDAKFLAMHGVPADKVHDDLGESIRRHAYPGDGEKIKAALDLALETRTPYSCEYRCKVSEGTYRWIYARGEASFDEAGKPTLIAGISVDIHEQKTAAEEIKDLQNRFQRSAEATDLGVWYCDLPFDVLNWNKEVKNHFFLPHDAHVTIDIFYDRIHPDDREPTKAAIQQAIDTRQPYDTTYRTTNPAKPNDLKWIRAVGWTDYNQSGEPVRFDGITLDVTSELRRNHELRVAKDEAERANLLKSAFLANMSHEIRTPLGAMLGFADLLRDPGTSPIERASFIDILSRNGEQLSVIINDILDLSKVEAGHLTLEFTDSHPDRIAADALSLLRVKAKEKDLVLDYRPDDSTPQTVVTDPTRVRQVLLNLVSNAIKFTKFGSVILRSYGSKTKDGRNTLCFEVEDTGMGLQPDQYEKVFEAFVQADGSMTRRFGGTGLGLALSRQLARALGGDVVVLKSKPDVGTTFQFQVLDQPEKRDGAVQKIRDDFKETTALATDVIQGVKVLVVDDAPDNQQLLWRFLTKYGAVVASAENGLQGYRKALAGDFDIVLMDIQMPEMDGYTATHKLRSAGFRKPIIALTAHAMTEVRQKCMNVGCTDHLPKPINPRELIGTIAKYTIRSTVFQNERRR